MERRPGIKTEIILIVLSILFAVGFLEGGLRLFTPFPLGASNKSPHAALGYVLNSRFPGVDSYGFRNVSRNRRGGEIAAVGDSHTYGLRVSSPESWPSILSAKTGRNVYNYGIPGYSPYQYHFLVKQAIDDGAQYIIVALLLQFDNGSDLAIPCGQMTTDYYQEFDELVDNDYETLCSKRIKADFNDDPTGVVNKRSLDFQSFVRHAKTILKEKIAITSAIDWLVFERYWTYHRFENSGETVTYRIKISQWLLDGLDSRVASLKETLLSIQEMCSAHSVNCGTLLLPSVGRTISLVRSDTFDIINKSPRELDREVELVDEIKEFLIDNEMEFTDAAPYVASAFQEGLSIDRELEVIVPYGSHPRRAGYAAYADAAADLFIKLQVSHKSIKPEFGK